MDNLAFGKFQNAVFFKIFKFPFIVEIFWKGKNWGGFRPFPVTHWKEIWISWKKRRFEIFQTLSCPFHNDVHGQWYTKGKISIAQAKAWKARNKNCLKFFLHKFFYFLTIQTYNERIWIFSQFQEIKRGYDVWEFCKKCDLNLRPKALA